MMTTIDLIALTLTLALIGPLFIAMICIVICDLAPAERIPQWLEDFANWSMDAVDRLLSAIFLR